jgi:hypothetical protein
MSRVDKALGLPPKLLARDYSEPSLHPETLRDEVQFQWDQSMSE